MVPDSRGARERLERRIRDQYLQDARAGLRVNILGHMVDLATKTPAEIDDLARRQANETARDAIARRERK